jgi:small subunit ribosomal protein S8
MIDPIADMLTRIRNASAVKKPEVLIPMSKIKYEIAKILKNEGWIYDMEIIKIPIEKNKSASFDKLRLVLKYKKSGRPAIANLKRISKPGLRIYANKNELPRVLNNFGIAILSTSRGLMTNKEAGKQNIGGEIICEIY